MRVKLEQNAQNLKQWELYQPVSSLSSKENLPKPFPFSRVSPGEKDIRFEDGEVGKPDGRGDRIRM
jgi:hypothetical protein